MEEQVKGFRKQKDLTKKQILKKQDSNGQDMQKLFSLCQILVNRSAQTEEKMSQLENRVDIVVPVIEFEYTGLVKLLVSKGLLTEEELIESVEKQRIAYMIRLEADTDSQLGLVNVDRPAQGGDVVVVGFEAYDTDGKYVKEMSNNYFMTTVGITQLGFPQLMPNISAALVGMKTGEVKEAIECYFPDDYKVNVSVAGQTMRFKLTLHRVKEKSPIEEAKTNQTEEVKQTESKQEGENS